MMNPEPSRHETADWPPISVVVIGRNEGERLLRCLRSIRSADYPAGRLEVLYADCGSTDNSCAAAELEGARVLRLQPQRPTAAVARNAGLEAARHGLVHFFDGDTILHRDWLKKAVRALDDPAFFGVFGRREEIAPRATVYNFWMHHDWYMPPGPSGACGGDVLFRRARLLRVGGYDPTLIAGEERDLCHRMIHDGGGAVLRLDEPMTLHDIDMHRFGQYWKRCVRSGYAYAQVAARYRDLRAWRRTCRRNLAHAVVLAAVVALSAVLGWWWLLAAWGVLLCAAIARDAWRCRRQVGSMGGALLYAVHHYLSKVPTTVGHLDYYLRRWRGAAPKGLIEYRGEGVCPRADG